MPIKFFWNRDFWIWINKDSIWLIFDSKSPTISSKEDTSSYVSLVNLSLSGKFDQIVWTLFVINSWISSFCFPIYLVIFCLLFIFSQKSSNVLNASPNEIEEGLFVLFSIERENTIMIHFKLIFESKDYKSLDFEFELDKIKSIISFNFFPLFKLSLFSPKIS